MLQLYFVNNYIPQSLHVAGERGLGGPCELANDLLRLCKLCMGQI